MYNSIQLIGRLGDDPQSRGNDPENPIVVLNMATSNNYVNRNGEKVDETTWHKITLYGGLAKYASYLTKGNLVFVEGSLEKKDYVDQNGIKRVDVYVKATGLKNLTPKSASNEQSQSQTPAYQQPTAQRTQPVQQQPAQRAQPVQQQPVQRTQPVQQPTAQRTQPVQQRVVPTVQPPQFTEEDFNFEPQGDELPF